VLARAPVLVAKQWPPRSNVVANMTATLCACRVDRPHTIGSHHVCAALGIASTRSKSTERRCHSLGATAGCAQPVRSSEWQAHSYDVDVAVHDHGRPCSNQKGGAVADIESHVGFIEATRSNSRS